MAKDVDTGLVVIAYNAGVERVAPIDTAAADEAGCVRNRGAVADGLLGDDVDDAGDGVAAIERRAAAAHHLDLVDHCRGQLLEQIKAGEGAVDGTAVDEHLRVGSAKSVEADVEGAAVLAGVFDADTSLIFKSFAKIDGTCGLELAPVDNTHNRRRFHTADGVLGGGDDNLIESHGVGLERKFQFDSLLGGHRDAVRCLAETDQPHDDVVSTFGTVGYVEMARGVGYGTDGGAFDLYVSVGNMLACF